MKRVTAMVLFVSGMAFAGQAAMATTFAVGTCRPKLPSFTTISAAVAGVPAGSIIEVCPGIYPEQVTISTPLTLLGTNDGNADRAVIVIPPNGMVANASSADVGPVGAQVAVTTGPVNIQGITVDGAGVNDTAPFSALVGIFYGSGSFGVVEGVTVRNEIFNTFGIGIFAENENGSVLAIKIEDSSVYNVDDGGISVNAFSGKNELVGTVEFNDVDEGGLAGIATDSTGNVVANNVVTDSTQGIESIQSNTIVGNTIALSGSGIFTFPQSGTGGIVESNFMWLAGTGIITDVDGETIKRNTILGSGSGIDFGCSSRPVTDNLINDAGTGLAHVPSSFNQFNNIINADTIRSTGGCL